MTAAAGVEQRPAVATRARARAATLAVVGAAQLAVFAPIAIWRYVDGDEGSYLAAAALVGDGRLPYHDFLYPQTPVLPYVYGAWAFATGESWYAARLLSALFAAAAGVLLFQHLSRRRGAAQAVLGAVLFASSVLVSTWFPLAKTYALSTLLLFGAFVLAERLDARRLDWLLCGALLGAAVGVRLLFAAAVPVFMWFAWRRWKNALLPLGAGLGAGLLPVFAFAAADPARFWFSNVGVHGARSSEGLVGDLTQKLRVAENLVGIGTPGGAVPQLVLLLAAAAASLVVAARARRIPFAFAVAGALALASFLPTPTYPQYFCTAVPFLIVGVLESVQLDRRALLVAGVVATLYAAIGLADVSRTLRSFPDQRVAAVEDVAAQIEARTALGETVISSWPGYLFGTSAQPYPGLENDFAPHDAAPLSDERAHRYRLANAHDVEQAIAAGRSRLLVVKMWHDLPPVPDWEGAAARGGYRLVATIAPAGRAEVGGSVRIYERGSR